MCNSVVDRNEVNISGVTFCMTCVLYESCFKKRMSRSFPLSNIAIYRLVDYANRHSPVHLSTKVPVPNSTSINLLTLWRSSKCKGVRSGWLLMSHGSIFGLIDFLIDWLGRLYHFCRLVMSCIATSWSLFFRVNLGSVHSAKEVCNPL